MDARMPAPRPEVVRFQRRRPLTVHGTTPLVPVDIRMVPVHYVADSRTYVLREIAVTRREFPPNPLILNDRDKKVCMVIYTLPVTSFE